VTGDGFSGDELRTLSLVRLLRALFQLSTVASLMDASTMRIGAQGGKIETGVVVKQALVSLKKQPFIYQEQSHLLDQNIEK
jgi:hypothetical protein